MKIIFFIKKFPEPSETFILNQVIHFINEGFDVEIVSIFPGDLTNKHAAFNEYDIATRTSYLSTSKKQSKLNKFAQRLKIVLPNLKNPHVIKALNPFRYGKNALGLLMPTIVSMNRPFCSDIIIAHFGPTGVLANQLRELGVLQGDLVTVFHGADMSIKHLLKSNLRGYEKLFKQGELMLPISQLWKNKLISLGCAPEKIEVVRMGIEPEFFSYQPKENLGSPLHFLTVSRLHEKKGLDVALKACEILRSKGIDFKYTIVGYGELYEQLYRYILSAQLQDQVEIMGFQPQEKIQHLLRKADIFLLPSKKAANGDMEGIPVALMEAMAVGIPVISTTHSGIPELIQNRISGWLVPENDPVALAEVIMKLNGNEFDIAKITTNARKKVDTEFNQHVAYSKLIEVLSLMSADKTV